MHFLKILAFASALIVPACLPAQTATTKAEPSLPDRQVSQSSPWWNHAVFYEIYPRSFQDSNGDGVGDLNGIAERLPYLQRLGVNAIWIAPMYPSPQVDFGYDISDYQAVDPQYGSLADMDRLIAQAGKHGIRVVLDMVLNHTSDKHAWFAESASSRTNAKADWYVWNDGVPASSAGVSAYQKRFEHEGRVPPNNWTSLFGGSAWEWVAARHQFYYHKFYKQQPDLNWRNPAVEQAAFGAMRFWLDRGIAGFRLDAIPTLFEDPALRNEPETGGLNAQGDPNLSDLYTSNLPEVHQVIRRMRAMVAAYPGDRVLIGETYLPNTAELEKWYGGPAQDELQLPMDMLLGFSNQLSAPLFRKYITEAETQLHGAAPLFVFDNHDNVRSVDRYAPQDATPEQRAAIGRLLATVLLTTRDAALLYQGEELGMVTSTPTRREDVKDPIGITGWPNEKGRDGERTPMQWTAGPQAGFSSNPHPWLPIPASYKTVNAAAESADSGSLLAWYQQLISLRVSQPAVRTGGIAMLDTGNPKVLSYLRTPPTGSPVGSAPVLVLVNMTASVQQIPLDIAQGYGSLRAQTLLTDGASSAAGLQGSVTLPAYASWVGALQ